MHSRERTVPRTVTRTLAARCSWQPLIVCASRRAVGSARFVPQDALGLRRPVDHLAAALRQLVCVAPRRFAPPRARRTVSCWRLHVLSSPLAWLALWPSCRLYEPPRAHVAASPVGRPPPVRGRRDEDPDDAAHRPRAQERSGLPTVYARPTRIAQVLRCCRRPAVRARRGQMSRSTRQVRTSSVPPSSPPLRSSSRCAPRRRHHHPRPCHSDRRRR